MKERELAFPAMTIEAGGYSQGMTLRDWFAGQALQALIIADGCIKDHFAMLAYRHADEMIKEREKE